MSFLTVGSLRLLGPHVLDKHVFHHVSYIGLNSRAFVKPVFDLIFLINFSDGRSLV
jgi:hypothetical protein